MNARGPASRCPSSVALVDHGELHRIAERLRERLHLRRQAIESALQPLFPGDTPLHRTIRHVLLGDATRIRASLALVASEAAGGRADDALPVAVAFELLHTASLIHDDIMDGAQQRRGRPCVHRVFGTDLAITAGDALIFEAYRCLLESRPRPSAQVLATFTACAAAACRGQSLDLRFADGPGSLRQYLAMIRAKTGSMMQAPTECAAVMAGAPPAWQGAFRDYGRCLGMAFQIADDALDWLGPADTAGKTLGNDLRNGSGSALLILGRHACDGAGRAAWARALRLARAGNMAPLLALMHAHGAVAATQRLAERYAQRAVRALQHVGMEPARTELATIAAIVGRWKVPPPPQPRGGEGDHHARTAQAALLRGFAGDHPA